MKRNSFLYFGLLLIILTVFGLVVTFKTNAADSPYASRIRPFTSVPSTCAENSVGYSMTLHKLYICTNTGFVDIATGSGFANTSLSNLASVAINTSLLPATTGIISLGDPTHGWNSIVLNSDGSATHRTTITSTASAPRAITFPNEAGTICTTGSICSGYLGGSGTTNSLVKFTPDGTHVGDSRITDDGTDISIDSGAGQVVIGDAASIGNSSRITISDIDNSMELRANRLILGNASLTTKSYININGSSADPTDQTIYEQTRGEWGAGDVNDFGNSTKVEVNDVTQTIEAVAATAINLDSKGGVTTIGDVNASGNGTKLTVSDTAQTITITSPDTEIEGVLSVYSGIQAGQPGATYLGSTTAPFSSAFIGNATNNSSQITGTFTGNRVFTIPDVTGTAGVLLSNSATLNFGNLAAIGCEDLTITVTGAVSGDTVSLAVPNGSVTSTGFYPTPWVSANDTVTVRYCTLVSGDPASGTFKVDVWKH